MASIAIRNLDDEVKACLRVRAASNGRSVEEEVWLILRDAFDDRVFPFDSDDARATGEIRALLAQRGQSIGPHGRRSVNQTDDPLPLCTGS